ERITDLPLSLFRYAAGNEKQGKQQNGSGAARPARRTCRAARPPSTTDSAEEHHLPRRDTTHPAAEVRVRLGVRVETLKRACRQAADRLPGPVDALLSRRVRREPAFDSAGILTAFCHQRLEHRHQPLWVDARGHEISDGGVVRLAFRIPPVAREYRRAAD